jgi:hypothetical protein
MIHNLIRLIWLCVKSFWFYKVKSYKIYGCQVELKDRVIVYRGKWL